VHARDGVINKKVNRYVVVFWRRLNVLWVSAGSDYDKIVNQSYDGDPLTTSTRIIY